MGLPHRKVWEFFCDLAVLFAPFHVPTVSSAFSRRINYTPSKKNRPFPAGIAYCVMWFASLYSKISSIAWPRHTAGASAPKMRAMVGAVS